MKNPEEGGGGIGLNGNGRECKNGGSDRNEDGKEGKGKKPIGVFKSMQRNREGVKIRERVVADWSASGRRKLCGCPSGDAMQ